MKHSTIFVAYDKLACDTICAAPTMDEAIAHTMRYMHVHDYNCKEFCYDELFTIINFEQDYRIGPRMEHVEDIITIMETGFIQSDE
jgi:hypothetical protein